MKKIAIIGECMIELNGEPFGDMQQSFGGDSLNTAVYLKRSTQLFNDCSDIEVSYISALGKDNLSQELKRRWQQEGIDTKWVLTDQKRSPGLYLIQLDSTGERTFLYWRDQSAARYMMQHPDFHLVAQSLQSFDTIYLTGISLAILPKEDCQKLLEMLTQLRNSGIEIIFDSNYRQTLWSTDNAESIKDVYTKAYQCSSLCLVTFDDEAAIWGDSTPKETILRLHQLGVENVVIKAGKDGCMFSSKNQHTTFVTTQPVTQVVDTTSAGDAFNGGFLARYLSNSPLLDACQQGNQLAGVVIQHKGAIIPMDELSKALQSPQ